MNALDHRLVLRVVLLPSCSVEGTTLGSEHRRDMLARLQKRKLQHRSLMRGSLRHQVLRVLRLRRSLSSQRQGR